MAVAFVDGCGQCGLLHTHNLGNHAHKYDQGQGQESSVEGALGIGLFAGDSQNEETQGDTTDKSIEGKRGLQNSTQVLHDEDQAEGGNAKAQGHPLGIGGTLLRRDFDVHAIDQQIFAGHSGQGVQGRGHGAVFEKEKL